MVRALGDERFEGEWSCKDTSGEKHRQRFRICLDVRQKQLVCDEEGLKSHHELQKRPEKLERTARALEQSEHPL
jgi:hypothetical protein